MKESPEIIMRGSKDLTRTLQEYASSAGNPNQEYLRDKLENIQQRLSRCITSKYRLILLCYENS
jgi:hypothetical protein